MRTHYTEFQSRPWVALGDFNAILSSSNRCGGSTSWYGHMDDFGSCVQAFELMQVPYTGMRYSWHNGQLRRDAILKKLDWVFGNPVWFSIWPAITSEFFPQDTSDHSAMVVRFGALILKVKSPFKFLNFWAEREDFLGLVEDVWWTLIEGNSMFRFTQRLALLKSKLRSLHRHHSSHISSR